MSYLMGLMYVTLNTESEMQGNKLTTSCFLLQLKLVGAVSGFVAIA